MTVTSSRQGRDAFTLVELLTVLAVIGILATLIFTALGKARESAQAVGGQSALRQLGVAVDLFSKEHQGTFPGPLRPEQVPYYDSRETERLSYWLAPYLDVQTDGGTAVLVEAMVPPAYPIDEISGEPRTFVLNTEAKNPNASEIINVWGAPADLSPGGQPIAPASIYKVVNPAKTWAISDADQRHPRVSGTSWATSTPEEPIHGDNRHVVFLDWHVESVPQDAELFASPGPPGAP